MNSSAALGAGAIGAAAGLVIAALGRIPLLGNIIAPLGWVASVGAGMLYVSFAASGGSAVAVGAGALGGAVPAAIKGAVQGLSSSILIVMYGVVQAASDLSGDEAGSVPLTASMTAEELIGGTLLIAVRAGVLGAVGGMAYAAKQDRSKQ